VVRYPERSFSTDHPFRLLFALFPLGKETKKLMKIQADALLIIPNEMMCISRGEFADLLRIPRKCRCAKACGIPDENWWISKGRPAEKPISPAAVSTM
jgi:hypothetical protein